MLTSARNPKVAAAVRLKKRALREEDRRFLVEGMPLFVGSGLGDTLPLRFNCPHETILCELGRS